MGKSADRWGATLLVAAVLSALCLCVPALRGQALALDEHVSYYCSGAPSLGELWRRCSDAAVLPPLSHLFERVALAIGGRSESVFRLSSMIAYVLSVPVVWWVGRFLGGPIAGGVAAIVVAWHPGMLDEVRFARCYGLVLLLSSLSTACVLRWMHRPESRGWLVAWGVTAAGLCWTHYLAAPLVAVQAALIILCLFQLPRSRRQDVEVGVAMAVIAVAVSCVPLGPALLRLQEWGRHIEYQRIPATILDAFGAKWTLPAIVLLVVSVMWRRLGGRAATEETESIERARVSMTWPVLLWLLPLAVVGGMALFGSPMLASPRYRVMVVGPSAVALGLAVSRAFLPSIAVVGAVGVLVLSTYLHGFSPPVAGRLANPIEEEWKRIGVELHSTIDDPTVLVFTQTGLAEGVLLPVLSSSERFRKYVACRLGGFYTGSERALPIPILWNGSGRLRDEYRTLLNARGVREVWIVGANDTDLNAQSLPVFARFVESAGFSKAAEESRPGMTVLRFEAVERRSTGLDKGK
jgi:4-amino-4-deoxy-L-arabinose transferase-like glycosyltransferase